MDAQWNPAMFGIWIFIWILSLLVVTVIQCVCWWRLFQKAGEPGWASIVPVYSAYILCKITVKYGWLFLVGLIPGVGSIWGIVLAALLAKSFGRGAGFSVGLIFLPVIFYPLLAFGDYDYVGSTDLF